MNAEALGQVGSEGWIFVIALVAIVLVVLAVFCFIKKRIIEAVVALLLVVGAFLYAIFVPDSDFSIWVTANVLPHVSVDLANKYVDGDVIFEHVIGEPREETDAIGNFLAERIESFAIATYEEYAEESYEVQLKDALLQIEYTDGALTIMITKDD